MSMLARALCLAITFTAVAPALHAEFRTGPIDSFHGTDGWGPLTTPTKASNGVIFGVTPYGGNFGTYAGVVYTMEADNGLVKKVIHHFNPATDGMLPESSLTERDKSGEMYGVTRDGGSGGCGTIFKIDAAGNFSVVKHLVSTTGCHPIGKLQFGVNGMLYGTTYEGGFRNEGTLFQLDPAGTITVLRNFGDDVGKKVGVDGTYPVSGVAIFQYDVLYGVTSQGGANQVGTLYSYNLSNGRYKIVHDFDPSTTGAHPIAAPVFHKGQRALYGTTQSGGGFQANGTLWTYLIANDALRVVHPFSATDEDGQQPYGELLVGSNGVLYGTTTKGGHDHVGTAFQLDVSASPFGTYLKLVDFRAPDEHTKVGRHPFAGLMEFKKNYMLGTVQQGGDAEMGAVYRLRDSPVQRHSATQSPGSTWVLEPVR